MATILIADDRSMNRQYLITLLSYFGHRLLEAANGEEALRLAEAEHPQLVISDMVMPKMDGEELAARLRTNPHLAGTRVIFYSATYSVRDAQMVADSVGAFGVLPKPSEPDVILALVNRALGPAAVNQPLPPSSAPSMECAAKLPEDLSALETVSYRLLALTEMTLELGSERDPDRLLEGVAHLLRKLLPSKNAAVALVAADGRSLRYFRSGRLPEATLWPEDVPGLMRLIKENAAASSLMVVPLRSTAASHGWLCVTERLGNERFDSEDRRVVEILAAQAAVSYEKALDRKQADDRIQEQNRELAVRLEAFEAANRSLQAFAYSVSHDLRAPLRLIEGFAAILQEDYASKLDAEGAHAVQVIAGNASRMDRLIEDLLTFSGASAMKLKKSEIDMEALARAVAEELAAMEPGRRVEVTLHRLHRATGDAAMIRQVFMNLLSNARKFTRRRPDARIEIGSRQEAGATIYYISDNGAGFEMEFADKLFGVFQRFHGAEEFEGTGIGLAIVKEIVERHGGKVRAQSKVGEGATICFTLGAAQTEPQTEAELTDQLCISV